jgi:hypothetical protein
MVTGTIRGLGQAVEGSEPVRPMLQREFISIHMPEQSVDSFIEPFR